MLKRMKFVSETSGGIRYVEYDPVEKTYSTDYYKVNGGHHKSEPAKLKDIRKVVRQCQLDGYAEY